MPNTESRVCDCAEEVTGTSAPDTPSGERPRRRPLAIVAFILALAGIPLVGLVTGAVAAILGGLALSRIQGRPGSSGSGFAVAAICIGIGDMVLWVMILGVLLPRMSGPPVSPVEQLLLRSAAGIERAPAHIRNALEANVFFVVEQTRRPSFLPPESFGGSGVILGESDGRHVILTSRHVVDPSFGRPSNPQNSGASITAHFHDGSSAKAFLLWVAPYDVDLALVATGAGAERIPLSERPIPADAEIGERVFAVGNPHELSWSYNEGIISGIREAQNGPVRVKILQTQTPINQGNSGGGLYDMTGNLIGIVTWTKDKAQAEGISFALTYNDFLALYRGDGPAGR
jgi:S1-C subfamily serine protease